MKKIPSVYRRDPDDPKHVIPHDVTPGCEWVLDGEGLATRKFDGTCIMLDETGDWWARREVRPKKSEPDGFIQVDRDTHSGKAYGWVPIEQSSFVKHFHEAEANLTGDPEPGTYELIGPKINGNPEGEPMHELIRHGTVVLTGTIPYVMDTCREKGWEGVVWHHPDGRMAKLKVKDIKEVRNRG